MSELRTRPGQGEKYWFFGMPAIVRSPEGAMPIVIEIHVPPGGHTPLHVHQDLEDSFYVVSGRLIVRSGDETCIAEAGDYVSLPAGVPQTLYALGENAVLLQTHARADFLDFIRQGGTPMEPGSEPPAEIDLERMHQIAGATGQTVVGPPMTDDEANAIAAAHV
jgi:quercetin dioxygenase-like cupin family protein